MSQKVLIIGICGVTCGGKTTIANKLNNILPSSKILCQDDYFLDVSDPRHKWIESLDHINFDILTSLDMEKMHSDILKFIGNKTIITPGEKNHQKNFKLSLDNNLNKAVIEKICNDNIEVLIIEGFCVFNYKPMRDLFSLKYYFTLSKEECFKRRTLRVYDPPDCPGYFEICAWPEHLSQLEEVKKEFNITYFDEHTNNILELILQEILNQF
ncbi:unnamed protein product [Brassicogethes aeneus]|uniref:Phosphoribulokinase/uridine kinase domain-containing protein n=1 Tax=Brassicogethes aeneus TaxID=1431903 RepID=A0A9P0ASJ0_BRAAE|nr:unnamed protein product [Brassicogethes aeneus]